jgi:hypothetical protein
MPSNTKSTRSLGAGSSGRTHHLAAGLCCSASRCHASSGSRSRRRRDRGHSARRRPSDRCAHIPGRPQGGAQQPLSEDSRRPPHNPTGVQLSLVHDLPKPSPPARSSPPTTASATTRSTAAAASPCATTAGLVLSLKLTLTGRPQCRSHAMPSLSQSLSVLASYSELLTSKLVMDCYHFWSCPPRPAAQRVRLIQDRGYAALLVEGWQRPDPAGSGDERRDEDHRQRHH